MRYRNLIALLFLSFIISTAATNAFGDEHAVKVLYANSEEFIISLLYSARSAETAESEKEALIKTASKFAVVYSTVAGDKGLFLRKVDAIISSIRPLPGGRALETPGKPSYAGYEELLLKSQSRNALAAKVQDFVFGLIRATYPEKISAAERRALLDAAVSYAAVFSDLRKDDTLRLRVQRIVEAMPVDYPSTDDDLTAEFEKAMQHDNVMVMEYLITRLGPRFEPFVLGLIEKATYRGVSKSRRNGLLDTAMRLIKTHAGMHGDHSLHMKMHRMVFTAHLGEPVKSEPADSVHMIRIPPAERVEDYVFIPDNIIIRDGETVRWVNDDDLSHVIGSLDFYSDGHIAARDIPPGGAFEHAFPTPGEYYYSCYIHRAMTGKITVEPLNK